LGQRKKIDDRRAITFFFRAILNSVSVARDDSFFLFHSLSLSLVCVWSV